MAGSESEPGHPWTLCPGLLTTGAQAGHLWQALFLDPRQALQPALHWSGKQAGVFQRIPGMRPYHLPARSTWGKADTRQEPDLNQISAGYPEGFHQ